MSYLERLNETMHEIVCRGIVLDAERGAVNAWIFMKEHGVSETIMLRVLGHPNRRRNLDTSALHGARRDGLPAIRR